MQCTHRSTDANFCLYSASEQTGAKPPPAPPLPALAAPPADADELLLTGRVIDTLQRDTAISPCRWRSWPTPAEPSTRRSS